MWFQSRYGKSALMWQWHSILLLLWGWKWGLLNCRTFLMQPCHCETSTFWIHSYCLTFHPANILPWLYWEIPEKGYFLFIFFLGFGGWGTVAPRTPLPPKKRDEEFCSAADCQTGNVGCIRSPFPFKLSFTDLVVKATDVIRSLLLLPCVVVCQRSLTSFLLSLSQY